MDKIFKIQDKLRHQHIPVQQNMGLTFADATSTLLLLTQNKQNYVAMRVKVFEVLSLSDSGYENDDKHPICNLFYS